jgi:hypothetical protein
LIKNKDFALVISCPKDEKGSGGLFSYRGYEIEKIDALSTSGITVAGQRFVRLLRGYSKTDSVGEILIYTCKGIEDHYFIENLSDAHEIIWDGQNYIVTSTFMNTILWVSIGGKITKKWIAPGEKDSWHLNGLFLNNDDLFVSAFGKFQKYQEWRTHKNDCSGIIFNIATGEEVIRGMSCPHNPRLIDGNWLICNSAKSEILQIDPTDGIIIRRLKLNGWTRGIAFCEELIFAGESANRHTFLLGETASIAVICRKTWNILQRIPIQCREISDLALVPIDLCQGLKKGS